MSLGMRFGDEQGMAMIVSVLVLLLLTAIGIAATTIRK